MEKIEINAEKFDQALHKLSYIRDKLIKVDEYLIKSLLSDAICLFLDAIEINDAEQKRESHKTKSV